MSTLLIFYSYTGRTHYEARSLSKQLGVETLWIHERKHRSSINASFIGRSQARKGLASPIEPVPVKYTDYDSFILMSPIWGGYPAPAFNAVVKELPKGSRVRVILTSDSGRMKDRAGLKRRLEDAGLTVTSIEVMKTIDLDKRDRLHAKRVRMEQASQEAAGNNAEQPSDNTASGNS